MEVHFTPATQDKLEKLASQTGRPSEELVEEVVAGYLEVAELSERIESRYADLETGTVKPIPGDEVEAYFREKSAAAQRLRPNS